MPSNNSKYTQEMREQTAEYILRNGKSATSAAEELGIVTHRKTALSICDRILELNETGVLEI